MNDKLVVVYTAAGQLNAQVIKGLLEAAGIPAVISQEGAGDVFGFTIGPLGLADILVTEEQAAAARDLLEAMKHGELETEEEENPKSS